MKHMVFLSHAKEDAATANAICRGLEAKGIGCWVAPRDVTPGTDWGEAIEGALRECKVMVVVFSPLSNASDDVYREIAGAADGNMKIVLFQIEKTTLAPRLKYFLRTSQWLDGDPKPSGMEIDYLADTIRGLISGSGVLEDSRHRLLSARRRKQRRKALLFTLPVAAALAALVFLWIQYRESQAADGRSGGAAPRTGVFSLHSIPSGAAVFLNGDSAGVTPLVRLDCEPGLYTLEFRKEGYTSQDTVVSIGAGERVVLSLPLGEDAPVPRETAENQAVDFGTLSVLSTPPDAAIWIGGSRIGTTPLRNHRLPAGSYRVVVKAEGFEEFPKDVEIRGERNSSFNARLLKITGQLRATSEPSGAEVWIAGRRAGVTPVTIDSLPPGEHSIIFRKAGYIEDRRTASVEARAEGRVRGILNEAFCDLTVQVIPSGEIWVDGERKAEDGNRPCSADLPFGSHTITAAHPTFGRWTKEVRLGAADTTIVFDFTPKFQIKVLSEPLYAEIWIDGEFSGIYTPSDLHLRPGEHTILVKKEGYTTVDDPVSLTLEEDRPQPFHFTLHAAP